jgi:hypothetical protein
MLTVRDFLAYRERCSPDGRYWEPALPVPPSLIWRARDAWCVLTGRAIAIVQTSAIDVRRGVGAAHEDL